MAINPLTLKSDVGQMRAQTPVVFLGSLGRRLLRRGVIGGHGRVMPRGLVVAYKDGQVRHVRLKI